MLKDRSGWVFHNHGAIAVNGHFSNGSAATVFGEEEDLRVTQTSECPLRLEGILSSPHAVGHRLPEPA